MADDRRIRRAFESTDCVPRIERRFLHARFDVAAQRRVCLVIGTAGWGKSRTTGSWARTRRTAWLRHERHLGDPRHFVPGLIDELRQHAPPSTPVPAPTACGAGGEAEAMALCAWLRGWLRDELVLVVDDLHELAPDGDPVRLLEGLCRHAPDLLRIVLISRRECPFSLTRLRGQGEVFEMHAPELAFDAGEIAALLPDGPGATSLAERVLERTAGWPALTCLMVEMLRDVEPAQRVVALDRLARPGERLYSYLREEVLGHEPAEARDLLGRLAVVGEVSAAAVCTAADGIGVLADLARRGLVQRIPGHLDRWALVAPVREHFGYLAGPPAPERARLHSRAARECLDRGAHGDAVRHLVAGGEHTSCATLLAEHGAALVDSGRLDAVLEVASLPAEYLSDPRIQRVLGQARQVRGQWEEATECFQRARDTPGRMSAALAWRVGMLAYSRGEFGEVLTLPGRTAPDVGDTEDTARLSALIAHARRVTGDYPGCRAETARAVEAARRSGSPRAKAAALAAQAVLTAVDGDRLRSEACWVRALETAEGAGDLLQALRIRLLRAFHLVEGGLLREGLAASALVLQLSESYRDPFLTAHALGIRARASLRVGDLERATADLARARDLFQTLGSRFLAWPLCGLGDLYRLRGELARARAAYEQALALAEPGHDVLGTSGALIGLARVRAADDIVTARELAHRAVRLGEGLHQVQAALTSGWVALMAGDLDAAAAAAGSAAATARARRDDPGLAEALALGVLSSAEPVRRGAALAEAIRIWEDAGCRVEGAAGRVVADRIGVSIMGSDVDGAERALRVIGVDLESRAVAGPLAVVARAAPAVAIRTLGTFQVRRAGVPVPRSAWQSRKARELLKILVARRRPVTRDQLIEILWPEADPARAGNRLSVLLHTLRDVLTPPDRPAAGGALATDDQAVWLDRGQVTVDVDEFLTHAAAALGAGQGHVVDRLVAAEAEHTGDFLEEDPYQEWAVPLAEDVRTAHMALLRALISALRERSDPEGVLRYARRLLRQDPYDEQAHRALVQAHCDTRRHGEARRCYRTYALRMAELGVEPAPFPHPSAHRRTG